MPKFNKDKRSDKKSFGGKSFGSRGPGGHSFGGGRDRDRERPQMHKATCDECGQKCEVPFRPTGDRPIYCSDCFEGRSDRDDRRESFGSRRERPGFKERQMFSATCSGCGNKCEVPFRPTGEKPVYCEKCFDKNKGGTSVSTGGGDIQLKKQIDILNTKVDKILEILSMSGIADVDDEMDSDIDWDIIEDDTIDDDVKEDMVKKVAKPSGDKKVKEEKKKADVKVEKTLEPKKAAKTEKVVAKKTATKKKAVAKKKK